MEIIFKKIKRTCCILKMEDGEVGVITTKSGNIEGVIVDCRYADRDATSKRYHSVGTTFGGSYESLHYAKPNDIMVDVFDKGTTVEF